MRRQIIFATLAAISIGGAGLLRASEPKVWADGLEVQSFNTGDAGPYNQTIEKALASGATWPRDPVRIGLEIQGGGTSYVAIRREDGPGEDPTTTVVTIVLSRLLDDSVASSWTRFAMDRQPDGSWRLTGVRRATRCMRSRSTDAFNAQPCP